jgi:hypothetical protein
LTPPNQPFCLPTPRPSGCLEWLLSREQYASRVGKTLHELGELCEETPILTAGNLLAQTEGWRG